MIKNYEFDMYHVRLFGNIKFEEQVTMHSWMGNLTDI